MYKDFASISSSTENFLINNVNGYTKVNNKKSEGVSDSDDVEVKVEGKVVINYVTKDNKKLHKTITLTDLVGSNYESIKKDFDNYNFIEVLGDTKGKIKEGTTYVTYIYDLTPLPPQTGINISPNYIKYISFLIFSLGLILLVKKIIFYY